MTRIRMNIDRLVLNGFQQLEGKALAQALQSQLLEVLAEPAARSEWAISHCTPVLKLGRMPLEAGPAGTSRFGRQMAKSIGRGLKQ